MSGRRSRACGLARIQRAAALVRHTIEPLDQGGAEVRVGPTCWQRRMIGVTSVALLSVLGACTGSSEETVVARRTLPTTTSSVAVTTPLNSDVVRTAFDRADVAHLPWLAPSATEMPRTVPSPDAPLPSLLDYLPGRAVLVVNPRISTLGAPVRSWSKLRLEFFGVDGHWTRLSLGDLGLAGSLTYPDTYGAGELSADGRWWAGSTRSGVVALNLATGRIWTFPARWGFGAWIPGRHAFLSGDEMVTVPQGVVSRAPYSWSQVGYEPGGVPLSWQRGPDGEAVLVEWDGGTRRRRAVVEGVVPPRAGQLWGVQATRGQFATTELRDSHAWIGVFDSQTGEPRAFLNHASGSELSYRAWLNPRVLLIAQSPYFLAWMPSTGHLYRVTDARTLRRDYWDINFAAPSTVP
jgi:hypothetical protein